MFASPLSDCSSSLISLATFSDIPALTFDLSLTSSAVELVELKELEDEDLTLSTSISGTNLAESSAIKIRIISIIPYTSYGCVLFLF